MKTKAALKILTGRLRTIWYAETDVSVFNPLILILSFLSILYRQVVNLRNRLYDLGIFKQNKLPCKVISVGNITVGGTGKTPFVIMLAKMLKTKGFRPAILSRGYGGKTKSPVNIVSDGIHIRMMHDEAGDEPFLIAKSAEGIPVLTGPKRILTGNVAVKSLGADVLILDDAFQHRSVFRDVDIVLLDREKPFGNGYLLPRGPLRESPDALKRAHFLIWKNRVLDGRFPKYYKQGIGAFFPVLSGFLRPEALIQGNTRDYIPLEYIRGKNVCAFAGIGSPENFRETIESLGGLVVEFLSFPDHYRYTSEDIADIQRRSSASGAEIVMTTEKDGIRLTDFPDFIKDIHILKVEMEIFPSPEELVTLILDRLK